MKATYTSEEVAKALGKNIHTTYRHLRSGTLKASQPGREWIITRSALIDYLGSEEAYRDVFERESDG